MDKLGEFASQTERFLRSLSRDLGLVPKKGEWLAANFTNESVGFDSEFAEAVAPNVADRGNEAINLIVGGTPIAAADIGLVTISTLSDFVRIGRALDPDESFEVGLYRNGGDPEWKAVSYSQISELRQLLATPIESYGSVQGVIHAWFSGAEPPFFQLRDILSGDLVHCVYRGHLHSKLLKAHERRGRTVVITYGRIRWDRGKHHIIDMTVDDLEITQPITESEFERLFGSMPAFTGDMTTAEYVDWIRESDD
jgi:hypothetical protein